jgi:hypothetical protein
MRGDPRATTQASVLRWFAQGWNIDFGRRRISGSQYGRSSSERLIWNAAGVMPATCTLLGPEGPGLAAARESGGRERTSGPRRVSPVGGARGVPPVL